MNRFRNPLKVNGIILGVVALLSLLTGTVRFEDLLFLLGTIMLLLSPVNLVIGMVRNRDRKPDGMGFILFAGLLLVLGFSTCSAGFAFGDINFH